MKPLKQTTTPSLTTVLLFLLVSSSSVYTCADELVVPVGSQGAEKAALDRPKTAMTTSAVEARFGAPLQKTTPVGNPPISSWEYPNYIVYFESDRVIHSVLKPYSDVEAAATTETPAPAQEAVSPAAAEPAPAADSETTAAPTAAAPVEATEAAK